MIFLHKPIILIKNQEIKFAEFGRVNAISTNRSFDLNITKHDGQQVQFTGIAREDFEPLADYFKQKDIKIRTEDGQVPQYQEQADDSDGEDVKEGDQEEGGMGKRIRKPVPGADVNMQDDDEDSEEDVSFKDEGSEGDSESAEEEGSEGGSAVEEMSDSEKKEMKKQLNKVTVSKEQRKGKPSKSDDKKDK